MCESGYETVPMARAGHAEALSWSRRRRRRRLLTASSSSGSHLDGRNSGALYFAPLRRARRPRLAAAAAAWADAPKTSLFGVVTIIIIIIRVVVINGFRDVARLGGGTVADLRRGGPGFDGRACLSALQLESASRVGMSGVVTWGEAATYGSDLGECCKYV